MRMKSGPRRLFLLILLAAIPSVKAEDQFSLAPVKLPMLVGSPIAQPIMPETAPETVPPAVVVSLREPIRIQSDSSLSPLWTALLSAVAALLGALVGSYSSTRNARAAIIQKTNELEIASIEHRLTQFIGPFIHLSEENKILAAELKRTQPSGAEFRTLTALLMPGWLDGLSEGDQNLLRAVVANGVKLRRMISEEGGSAVSPQLMPYFSKVSAHFRFLELAAAGSLDKDPARYSEYVYPRQLDGVMAAEQQRLHVRREMLRSQPDEAHPAMPDLIIANDLKLP